MCGIAGWVNFERQLTEEKYIMQNMVATLKKRGPDAGGIYSSENILLGHRRLVVVDPSGGIQPMTRSVANNDYTIVYNGELYNTEELRSELKELGFKFKSYSDTEVLLISYIAWGTDCVKHINGIYAFGIWEERERKLFLARDPLGVKPLFYAQREKSLIFGSELKALLAHPEVEPVIDKNGLLEIFSLGPGRSLGSGIFKNIYEIPPAHCMTFDVYGAYLWEFWKLESKPHEETMEQTVEHTRSLLIDAIERQLGADVPVCTFLSGGLDSSTITAVAANYFKKNNLGKLNTYSIDYVDNDKYFKANEYQPNSDSDFVEFMSHCINSKHHCVLIKNRDLAEALRNAVIANDLPGMADIDSSLYLLNIKWFMVTMLNRRDRMSMSNSLEVRVPFADYKIVEYVFNIPWNIKYCEKVDEGNTFQ